MIAKAQEEGVFKPEIEARFAAMAFYGAIEQLLTGWIFGLLPTGDEYYERAKWLVVETVCGGLERAGPSVVERPRWTGPPRGGPPIDCAQCKTTRSSAWRGRGCWRA